MACWLLLLAIISVLTSPLAAQTDRPPVAPARPVTDRYPGLTVVDPYRWMEGPPSKEFALWLDAQNQHTASTLARLPGRDSLFAAVSRLARPDDAPRRVRVGGDRLFFVRQLEPNQPPEWRVWDAGRESSLAVPPGPVLRLDPQPGGAAVAVSGGGATPTLRIIDVDRNAVVDSIRSATFLAWEQTGTAFYYRVGNALYRRMLGQALAAPRLVGRSGVGGAPVWARDDELVLRVGVNDVALAVTRDGDWHSVALASRRDRGTLHWRRVASRADSIADMALGDRLYLLSRRGSARGAVVALPATASGQRDTVVAPSTRVIGALAMASDGLYLVETTAGTGGVRRVERASHQVEELALPTEGSVRVGLADPTRPGVVVAIDRWIGPSAWHRVTTNGGVRLDITPAPDAGEARFVVKRRLVPSFDGTLVPVTTIHRRDLTLDGSPPLWIMAYGAYGIAMTPLYQSLGAALPVFLDRGGVYAVAHVRGGGEFGREWHHAGRAQNKPAGYRDLIAVVESLVVTGHGQAGRVAIEGGSGGGATVGMAGVTRPDLFRLVVTHVPDANTLRLHATPDGPYMIEEWGDSRTRQGVAALAAMDVTRHVRPGTAYPAWYLTTGLLDASVPPWMPAKLAAHLQAVSSGNRPVLLRVNPNDGHVPSPATSLAQVVDQLSLFYWQLGDPQFQPIVGGAKF